MQLTDRDREIIRLVQRHRFLRSSKIIALIGDSPQQILRRLQLLYHHGFLERPRAQIDYYHRGGSRHIVYGLGNKGAALLKRESGLAGDDLYWGGKNQSVGRLFLEHALLISEVMVALELACREQGRIKLVMDGEISLPDSLRLQREPFHWSVNLNSHLKLGIIPDQVFALEFAGRPGDRAIFFLEADRGTMPVTRKSLSHTSFHRKLLAYEATWTQNLHRSRFGLHRFRVLTVTTSVDRARHLAESAAQLKRGRGLFLFADVKSFLAQSPLAEIWNTAYSDQSISLLS